MKTFEKNTMPLGMVGVLFYLAHTIIGRLLWAEYDPITTDISSLTAKGAPNRELLTVFTTIYGIAMIMFVTGMIVKSFRQYHAAVRIGWIVLLAMNLVSLLGYALFPLTGDKTVMTFGNIMHIVVTVIVVFTTIASGYILTIGYLKQENMKKLGYFTLFMAVVITLVGLLNPIGMANGWNILGITERAVIYSLQFMIFVFSAYYTFFAKKNAVT